MDKDELHIIQLIEWIEDNLHLKLDAGVISSKSGYTKWHLQKMFKSYSGLTMLQYVRSRRLSKAAVELKYSNRPIVDIVKQYQFDTQSSFTRAFTTKYGVSPGKFREAKDMPLAEMSFKHSPNFEKYNAKGEYVYYDHLLLYGSLNEYLCPVSEIKKPHRVYRKEFRRKFRDNNDIANKNIFSLFRIAEHDSENVLCCCHLGVDSNYEGSTPLPVITGDFIKFDYEGDEDGIYDFVMNILVKLKSYNTIKRDYFDIEIFKGFDDGKVKYSYLFPIVFNAESISKIVSDD
jgi:AraC family transcriptional activator of mar-sox-rob regulon